MHQHYHCLLSTFSFRAGMIQQHNIELFYTIENKSQEQRLDRQLVIRLTEQRVLKAKSFVKNLTHPKFSESMEKSYRLQASTTARKALCLVDSPADTSPSLGGNVLFIGIKAKLAGHVSNETGKYLRFAKYMADSIGGETFDLNVVLSAEDVSAIMDIANKHNAYGIVVQGNGVNAEEQDFFASWQNLISPSFVSQFAPLIRWQTFRKSY